MPAINAGLVNESHQQARGLCIDERRKLVKERGRIEIVLLVNIEALEIS
jgi:hypothetical protein